MTDYIVYKEGGKLEVLFHGQSREEGFLMDPRNFVPGRDLVVISEVSGMNPDEEAKQQAQMYFDGEYQEPKHIDCWVAGALERQKCLKTEHT